MILCALSLSGASKSTLSLLREAEALIAKQKYSKALPLLLEADADTAARPIYRFNIGTRLGDAYWNLGRPQAAFDAYEKAIRAGQKIKSFSQTDSLIFNTAQRYTDFGKYDDAEALLEDVGFEENSAAWLRAKALMATIYSRQGYNGYALEMLNEVIAEYPEKDSNIGVMHQNRGYILWQMKHLDEAALDLHTAVALLKDADKYVALSNLAMLHSDMDKSDLALSEIEQALKYFQKNGGVKSMDYIIALRKKGEILSAANQKKEALKIFRQFVELEKGRLEKVLPEMSAQSRLDYWTMEKPLLSRAMLVAEEDPDFVADVALLRHQTSLWGMRDISTLKDDLKYTASDVRKNLPVNGVAIQFVEYEPEYGSDIYLAIITPKRGPSQVITLFAKDYLQDELMAYPYSAILDIVTAPVKQELDGLYTHEQIDADVWAKILNHLPAGTTDIYFTPEGIFHLWGIEHMPSASKRDIRFHRLSSMQVLANKKSDGGKISPALVAGGLNYTIYDPDEYFNEIITADSTRSFDCEYDAYERLVDYYDIIPGIQIFNDLPGTATEADYIHRILEDSDYRQILEEGELKRIFSKYHTVHLATHGYTIEPSINVRPRYIDKDVAIDRSLLYSGVALTNANNVTGLNRGQDGILSAREICDLDLSGVDLVVLSACQTACGWTVDEGVVGLVRALKMAGAKTIIASLWTVDDTSTSLFMQEFYRNLKDGKSKKDAFDGAVDYLKNYSRSYKMRKYDAGRMARRRNENAEEVEVSYTPYNAPSYYAPFILIDGIN